MKGKKNCQCGCGPDINQGVKFLKSPKLAIYNDLNHESMMEKNWKGTFDRYLNTLQGYR